jgi:uncharacterized membrane protein
MKNLLEFLKTTIIGGLFVMLPVLLVYLTLAEALGLIVALATPVADLLFDNHDLLAKFPVLFAVLVLVFASFVFGLLMRAQTGRLIGAWFERTLLGRLPAYNAIKSLTSGLADTEARSTFIPALMHSEEGVQELVYIVEDHGNGYLTVMFPWTPTPFAGSIKIVKKKLITPLDISMGEVTRVLSYWGVGVHELLAGSAFEPGAAAEKMQPGE